VNYPLSKEAVPALQATLCGHPVLPSFTLADLGSYQSGRDSCIHLLTGSRTNIRVLVMVLGTTNETTEEFTVTIHLGWAGCLDRSLVKRGTEVRRIPVMSPSNVELT
jgi:hypothetical protein